MNIQSFTSASAAPIVTRSAAEDKAEVKKGQEAPHAADQADTATISQAGDQTPADQAQEKEWTILFYLNGNNALSGQAIGQLRQLEYVGSTDKIDLVAQVARPKGLMDRWSGDWSGVRRYKIEHNGKKLTPGVIIGDFLTGMLPGKTKKIESPVLEDMGDKNMGSARTFEDFLTWGMTEYPAKRYMVVMLGPSEGLSGMMHDVVHDSKMSVASMGKAIENAHAATGKKIDVLTIDGSATNTMEIAYELKDNVKYLIGSQGIQAGMGMPLAQIANELKSANEEQGQDAITMVRYWTLMNSMGAALPGMSSTISAVDLEKMGAVKDSWNTLGQALLDAGVSGDKLNDLLDKTQDFQGKSTNEAYQNSRDAVHFCKLLLKDEEITDQAVKTAAQNAKAAIEDALVGDAATGKYVAEANGMSVFAPTHYGFFRPTGNDDLVVRSDVRDGGYEATKFAQETSWNEVLTEAGKDSWMNNALKKIGFSENALDTVHKTVGQHGGKVGAVANFASLAGWFNAINAWRGAEPAGFLFLNAQQAVYAGVAGSAYDAYQGVKSMVQAGTELKDTDEVINRGFDVARAGAKAVANLGYIVPELKPYAATAGMLMFFSPWIRDVYNVWDQYKEIRDGIELGQTQNMPMIQQWGAAAMAHYGSQQLWDHA